MKILTNTQSVQIGGIAQFISSVSQFLESKRKKNVELVGVDIIRVYDKKDRYLESRSQKGQFTVITHEVPCRKIREVLTEAKSLKNIEHEYQHIIKLYIDIIHQEKPDLIILNGTYFIPWCLYLAARKFNIPIILHYHGILTKETINWESHANSLMKQLEQTFDNSRLFYIFPSRIAKQVVEREVFGHRINKSAILPNPIPFHFFEVTVRGVRKNVGIIGRWTEIKNIKFIERLARYNQKIGSPLKLHIVTNLSDNKKAISRLSKLARLYKPMDSYKLGQFYGRMGIVICPSFFETYGNVPQEALATGTPALISPNMGVAETYRQLGLEDWIIDFNSVSNTYHKILEVANQDVAARVRQVMKQRLSPDRIGREFLRILASV